MPEPTRPEEPGESRLRATLKRFISVEDREIPVMLASAGLFFCVLASNYVIRPLRDEMGVSTSTDSLSWLFIGTLFGTLLLNPPFAILVARNSRRFFIPVVYRIVAATLVITYVLLIALPEPARKAVGQVFFVWTSVYNLLLVSVFWGFMADIFRSEQGKRLFGFMALGGSLGGIAGSTVATLAPWIGSFTLLLVAASALELALFFLRRIARRAPEDVVPPRSVDVNPWRDMGQGFRLLGKSRYMQAIAIYITLYGLSSTLLYFEQRKIVGGAIADRDERTAFFARIDLATNILSLLFQGYFTGRLLQRVGLVAGLLVMPVLSMFGLLGLELWPSLALLFVVQVVRRSSEYGIVKPAREVLWTVTTREEKYVAKQLVDVPIYRAGDSIGAWWEKLMTAIGLGLRGMTVTFLPLVAVWIALSFWLGRKQRALAAARENAPPV